MPINLTQESKQAPIPITCLTAAELPAWLEQQPAIVKQWVQTVGFTAVTDSSCLVPDSTGKLTQVLAGVANSNEYWGIAALATTLPAGVYTLANISDQNIIEQRAIAWGLAAYQFNRYKQPLAKELPTLVVSKECNYQAIIQQIDALCWVRDLINTPAEDMGPEELAQATMELAATFDADVEQIIGDELLTANYPAIHMVGRASSRAPRLIDIRWGKANKPLVTLVGKGVCFDTGGLDLKPAAGMLMMKKDMGGAAHALGLARLIMAANLPVQLRVLIPAVENSVSGNAYRPGDIINTRKGLSVEIGNTDAEGRLVLADALTAACEEQPKLLIDFATLTGAARIAMGADIGALFTPDDAVAEGIIKSAVKEQDPMWRMPIYAPYRKLLDSRFADLNNVSASPYGGAIIAAVFLQEFVNKDISWAHFDIMAWNLNSRPGRPEGGEAMGIRAVFSWLKSQFA